MHLLKILFDTILFFFLFWAFVLSTWAPLIKEFALKVIAWFAGLNEWFRKRF